MGIEEQAKISVIVPVYNAEEYLETCIQSICRQSIKELQIILVDDGSDEPESVHCPNVCGVCPCICI